MFTEKLHIQMHQLEKKGAETEAPNKLNLCLLTSKNLFHFHIYKTLIKVEMQNNLWNVTSLVRKKPELVDEVERYL